MSCVAAGCGVGGWTGPLPGDPSNNLSLSANSVYGGVDVSWTFPTSNPHAVAHVILLRSAVNNSANALQRAIVSGNTFFDKSTTTVPTTYFYWIRVVSVNGTVGALIGPASAVSKPNITDLLTLLTGQIEAGALAATLKADLISTTKISQDLIDEANLRKADFAGLTGAIETVRLGNAASMTFILKEIKERKTANDAFVREQNAIAVATGLNAAAILEEEQVRTTQNAALAIDTKFLIGEAGKVAGLIKTESDIRVKAESGIVKTVVDQTIRMNGIDSTISNVKTTRIGYSVKEGTNTPYDGDGTEIYPESTYSKTAYPEYVGARNYVMDATGVANWNNLPNKTTKLTWVVGLPLAKAVLAVGVTDANGNNATVQQAFSAQKTLNDGLKASYTMKLSVDKNGQKLIGGFGLYNDGVTVEAGFDVDTFWVGRSVLNSAGVVEKLKPFVITDNKVYLNEAIINKLTTTTIHTTGYGIFSGYATTGSLVGFNGAVTSNLIAEYGADYRSPIASAIIGRIASLPSGVNYRVGVAGVAGKANHDVNAYGIYGEGYVGGRFDGHSAGNSIIANGPAKFNGNVSVSGTLDVTAGITLNGSAFTGGPKGDKGDKGDTGTVSGNTVLLHSIGSNWVALNTINSSTPVYIRAASSLAGLS